MCLDINDQLNKINLLLGFLMLNFCLVLYEALCLEDVQTISGYTQVKSEDMQKAMSGKHFFTYVNEDLLKIFVFELQNLTIVNLSNLSHNTI